MKRLTNSQSHEIGLWEELIQTLLLLKSIDGMGKIHAEFCGQNSVALTISSLHDGQPTGYTIYLNPLGLKDAYDKVRVTWGEGNGLHEPKPFGETRRFLLHAIGETNKALVQAEIDNWDDDDDIGEYEEPDYHEFNAGGDLGGFMIYE